MIRLFRIFKKKKMGYIELKRFFFTKEYSVVLPDIAISRIRSRNKYIKGESCIDEFEIKFSSIEYLFKVVDTFQYARDSDFVADFENISISCCHFRFKFLNEKPE